MKCLNIHLFPANKCWQVKSAHYMGPFRVGGRRDASQNIMSLWRSVPVHPVTRWTKTTCPPPIHVPNRFTNPASASWSVTDPIKDRSPTGADRAPTGTEARRKPTGGCMHSRRPRAHQVERDRRRLCRGHRGQSGLRAAGGAKLLISSDRTARHCRRSTISDNGEMNPVSCWAESIPCPDRFANGRVSRLTRCLVNGDCPGIRHRFADNQRDIEFGGHKLEMYKYGTMK